MNRKTEIEILKEKLNYDESIRKQNIDYINKSFISLQSTLCKDLTLIRKNIKDFLQKRKISFSNFIKMFWIGYLFEVFSEKFDQELNERTPMILDDYVYNTKNHKNFLLWANRYFVNLSVNISISKKNKYDDSYVFEVYKKYEDIYSKYLKYNNSEILSKINNIKSAAAIYSPYYGEFSQLRENGTLSEIEVRLCKRWGYKTNKVNGKNKIKISLIMLFFRNKEFRNIFPRITKSKFEEVIEIKFTKAFHTANYIPKKTNL